MSATREEAIALLNGQLGAVLLESTASYVAPFFWETPAEEGGVRLRNGSMFFLNCGEGTFGVTADHVYQGYLEAKAALPNLSCQLFGLAITPEHRLIARHTSLDIATFRITDEEVRRIGRRVHQPNWPPQPPEIGQGVMFAGFPSVERIINDPNEVNFGIYFGSPLVTAVSDRNISCVFERQHWVDILGAGLPDANYDMGGVSGAPLFILNREPIMSWRLGGVVTEFRANLEILLATRGDFILTNGQITSRGLPM